MAAAESTSVPSRSKSTTGNRTPSIVSAAYDLPVLAPFAATLPPTATGPQHCSATRPDCPMVGDVDGDGRVDRVWIRRETACRFTLVVRTAGRALTAPIRPSCENPSELWRRGFPRVIALRPMDPVAGLEPEVLMWQGASNSGVRFFTARGRRLLPVRIEPEPFPRDEWNIGGFADAFSVHDCIRPHVLGVRTAVFARGRWTIVGEIYAVRRDAFVRVARRIRFARRPPDARGGWPDVPGDGFAHCGGTARGRP
jgi:hypothetical protein